VPTQYYVTNDGLAAALANTEVLKTMQGILAGRAHAQTIKSFNRKGWIESDKRHQLRADHNTLILSGAVERIREVLVTSPAPPDAAASNGHSKRDVTYTLATPPPPTFSPTVEKVRSVLAASDKQLTFSEIHAHPTLRKMNPGTLRWALQVLRRSGLARSTNDVNGEITEAVSMSA
jgi:hypothetical protein